MDGRPIIRHLVAAARMSLSIGSVNVAYQAGFHAAHPSRVLETRTCFAVYSSRRRSHELSALVGQAKPSLWYENIEANLDLSACATCHRLASRNNLHRSNPGGYCHFSPVLSGDRHNGPLASLGQAEAEDTTIAANSRVRETKVVTIAGFAWDAEVPEDEG